MNARTKRADRLKALNTKLADLTFYVRIAAIEMTPAEVGRTRNQIKRIERQIDEIEALDAKENRP